MGSSGETPITINVITLDSRTFTLQVIKQIPVPELKDQIASVTGVLSRQQRLICRGRVLQDDKLLSDYYVEDGHTLHLVVSEPVAPPSGSFPNHSASREQFRGPSDASYSPFGFPGGPFLRQPHAIDESLVNLSEFMSYLRQEYDSNGGNNEMRGNRGRQTNSVFSRAEEVLLRPVRLGDMLLSTRELLTHQVAASLLHQAMNLHNQSNIINPMARQNTQSDALRSGVLLQSLGSFLLELGLVTTTLQLGQAMSEAIVSAGPSVFLSHDGPNPLVLAHQPGPFQPVTSFDGLHTSTSQGSFRGHGAGFPVRHVGSGTQQGGSPMTRTNVNRDERATYQQGTPASYGMLVGPSMDSVEQLPNGVRTSESPDPPYIHSYRFTVFSKDSTENHGPSGEELPPEIFRMLRTTFPIGEIRVENADLQEVATGPVAENSQGEEERVTDEGISLSNLLRQSMPVISQVIGGATQAATSNSVEQRASTQGEEERVTGEGIFLSNLLRQAMPVIAQVTGGAAQSETSNGAEQRVSTQMENSDIGTSSQGNGHPSPPDSFDGVRF